MRSKGIRQGKRLPNCACPITNSNVIKIRMTLPNTVSGIAGRKAEVITPNEEVLWSGSRGQIAELSSTSSVDVYVRMSTGWGSWCLSERSTLVPGKKYAIAFAPPTFFHNAKLTIIEVDVIDAD